MHLSSSQELSSSLPFTNEETACGETGIPKAQLRFEINGNYGQEQSAVRDAVAHCPNGTPIVMLRKFAVVDTGYGRVACVKR